MSSSATVILSVLCNLSSIWWRKFDSKLNWNICNCPGSNRSNIFLSTKHVVKSFQKDWQHLSHTDNDSISNGHTWWWYWQQHWPLYLVNFCHIIFAISCFNFYTRNVSVNWDEHSALLSLLFARFGQHLLCYHPFHQQCVSWCVNDHDQIIQFTRICFGKWIAPDCRC